MGGCMCLCVSEDNSGDRSLPFAFTLLRLQESTQADSAHQACTASTSAANLSRCLNPDLLLITRPSASWALELQVRAIVPGLCDAGVEASVLPGRQPFYQLKYSKPIADLSGHPSSAHVARAFLQGT